MKNDKSAKRSKYVIVDGSAYLFRAYHAMPPLTTSSGKQVGAIYGVMSMLKKLQQKHRPERLVVVFDSKGPNFRHELYPLYKANRESMPEELQQQIAPLHTLIQAYGFPLISMPGVEADDLIATLAQQASNQEYQVLISSSDKDLMQLITNNIHMLIPSTEELIDIPAVQRKFGVLPEQIIDFLILTGDRIDNVPGVDKVGPKTAAKWLNEYGSLEQLIMHQQQLTGKIGENFRACIPQFPLTRQLVTLKTELELPQPISTLQLQQPDTDTLIPLLQQLEFHSLLQELTDSNILKKSIHTLLALQHSIETTTAGTVFLSFLPTKDVHYLQAELMDVEFLLDNTIYILNPSKHDGSLLIDAVKYLLQQNTHTVVSYQVKFLHHLAIRYGFSIQATIYDMLLAQYLMHNHAEEYAPNCQSIASIYQAWQKISSKNPSLAQVYHTIEQPLIVVLARMEAAGIAVDLALLKQQSQTAGEALANISAIIFQLAGTQFNLNSPKQLQHVLFTTLQLPMSGKTQKGQASTNEEVLGELAAQYPIAAQLLEYRHINKLKNTYLDALPNSIQASSNRIHTHYHQTMTATGRLSASNPNLQNIPKKTPLGKAIRQAFIAVTGYKLVAIDYSQIELRLLAHLSQDPTLLAAFANNIDIHALTATELFNVDLAAVTAEQRQTAKTINFGLLYGMSSFGLAKQLHISRNEAQTYMQHYFKKFPTVRAFLAGIIQYAETHGFVETITGRRIYCPEIHSKLAPKREAAKRAAINAPLQGGQADLIKLAMINIDRYLQQHPQHGKLLLQVHDELVFEIAETQLELMIPELTQLMETVITLSVPLTTTVAVHNHW